MNKFNYKKLTPFKWFVLQNFPFIEADFDAITDWQLFCKLGDELNKVIYSVNTLGSQVENLTDFVINYFDNLDIQEEVDTKINEMAESGELQEIIISYLQMQGVLSFDTIEDMAESEILIEGSTCIVFGNTNFNDGYIRFYKIEKIISANPTDIDGINLVTLNRDDLYARLIKDNTINDINILKKVILSIDKFEKEENEETDTERIQRAIDYLNENNGGSLYFPNGEYTLNDTIILYPNIRLIGESINGTIINGYFNKAFFEIDDKTQRNDNIEISYMTFHKDITNNNTPIIDLTSIGYSLLKNLSFYNHTQAYESIGVLLGALSYYNVIQDCQFRGFNIGISFIEQANANTIRGGTCISCVNGIDISATNSTRIIAHSCENLTGIAYNLHDHSLYNMLYGCRIEDCAVGIKTEYKSGGQASYGNMFISPIFYMREGQTDIINPTSNSIITNNTWYRAYNNTGKANFKATKKFGQLDLAQDTPTKITFLQTSWNIENGYNTSTDRFEAPENGNYLFNAQINLNNILDGDIIKIMLYVNGSVAVTRTFVGKQYDIQTSFCITSMLQLTQSDYVEIYASTSSNRVTTRPITSGCYFEGYMI